MATTTFPNDWRELDDAERAQVEAGAKVFANGDTDAYWRELRQLMKTEPTEVKNAGTSTLVNLKATSKR